MPEIRFPPSTAPSRNPVESGGRLINVFAEKAPDGSRSPYLFRRAPGLKDAFVAGTADARGALLVGSELHVVNGDTVFTVTKAGQQYTITALGGTIGGEGPVMIAHNMRSPTPQTLFVHSGGMSERDGSSITDFSDPDLPAINSIAFMDGYFFVTSADGRCFASDLNDTEFNELNFVTAEASTDGLVRAVAFGRDLLLMGRTTIEFWGNTGNPEGFPFSRGPVMSLGLKNTWAVAGHEFGFPGPLVWVASDSTVRRLDGYTPERISTPHIERLMTGTDEVFASAYVADGHACIAFTGPDFTVVHDLSTGEWHERASYGSDRWRAIWGVNAFNEWLTFDRGAAQAFRIDPAFRREGTDPLVMDLISTQAHRFPGRMAVPRASFDFVTGQGISSGIDPIEVAPRVSISWSDDGGRTFGNALLRELGRQGETRRVDVFRTGLTSRMGRQWRLQISDPVECALIGGSMEVEERGT